MCVWCLRLLDCLHYFSSYTFIYKASYNIRLLLVIDIQQKKNLKSHYLIKQTSFEYLFLGLYM